MTVLERFLDYVRYDTQSDENSDTCPSTAKQRIFGAHLAEELQGAGLSDAAMDEFGYVYGHLPASPGCEQMPVIGLIAHMDTSPDVSGANVQPRIIVYDGSNAGLLEPRWIGTELIVTDGTTLLGADDKAGVAEIVAACDRLYKDPSIRHGRIAVCFTPDEEIGSGADHFDFARFGAEYAYTVDGGELGEIEYENFNAASAVLTIHGVNTHPGSAKNKMRNALLYASEFLSMLPPAEVPSHTEGREGFYHVTDLNGDVSCAKLQMLIRDFDWDSFQARKDYLAKAAAYLNEKYGEGNFVLELRDSYYNMREKIEPTMHIVERAKAAMQAAGVTPQISLVRGGTDGARLSFEGLPCPNLSTGGLNFHSRYEAVPTLALKKMVEILTHIVAC